MPESTNMKKPGDARGRIMAFATAWIAIGVLVLNACSAHGRDATPADDSASAPAAGPAISSTSPTDIAGGAPSASLVQAATFSWEQLIAMNWASAMDGDRVPVRGQPAPPGQLQAVNLAAPRVWETLRSKSEVFPGIGTPHGAEMGPEADFGYDQAPVYRYDPAQVGTYQDVEPGVVPACHIRDANAPTPWIELSEAYEVGPEQMFAGMVPYKLAENRLARQRVLFAVLIDRSTYRYVAGHGWLDGGNPGSTVPAAATAQYLAQHEAAPSAGSPNLVSFPVGSLEIKAAWRRLSESERRSGRFFTSLARGYQAQDPSAHYAGKPGNADFPCYIDAYWGLVGIHLKVRTPSAPYYIWSTFEHVDNLVDSSGTPLEESSGRYIGNPQTPTTDPALTSRNAVAADPPTPETIQKMWPPTASAEPGKRLYYQNKSGTPTTQGIIAINRREHAIAEPVATVNQAAHEAISRFLSKDENRGLIPESLLNYRLVGVQWRPASKPVPGENVQPDPNQKDEVLRYPSIYYLANLTMETSYRLQNFSGGVQGHLPPPNQDLGVQDLVTDFDAMGVPLTNVVFGGASSSGQSPLYNMGGCMGCHGQIQGKGYDFSFVFRRGRLSAPEMDASIRLPLIDMVHPKDRK